jgi:hypothetical protein
MQIHLSKHTHNLLSHRYRWDTLHSTCCHGGQDGGHSWCNGLVVLGSWHSLVHMARTYSAHNLKV